MSLLWRHRHKHEPAPVEAPAEQGEQKPNEDQGEQKPE